MLSRHYAPHTALECAATQADVDFLVNLYETAGLKVARYVCDVNPTIAAKSLYADLHALDHVTRLMLGGESDPYTP